LVIGGLAAAPLLAWILARGAGDWLLAPYGFDVLLLIALESAGGYVGAQPGCNLVLSPTFDAPA
jgi:hypothetical protein